MNILTVTHDQLLSIHKTHPSWVATNRPEWMANDRPDLIINTTVPNYIVDSINQL